VTFVNPEPLALFADVICRRRRRGAGAAVRARRARAASDRPDLLRRLATERGFYVPSFYEPHYAGDGTLAGYTVAGRC